MSPISKWGPSTWTFFHVLAEQINESKYIELHQKLLTLLKRICAYLPCPECSKHATDFLSKITPEQISNKMDFKGMLYTFHNLVNKRNHKFKFQFENLTTYKNTNLKISFVNFVNTYNTKGDMNTVSDTMHRKIVINELQLFLSQNYMHFTQ
jgi:hypothetical protein